jgi:uridine kinase
MREFDLREIIIQAMLAHLSSARAIAIAGAGCTGKSTLAAELATRLRGDGVDATVVDLDGYFMPRAERARRGLSAYHPRVFDLARARDDVGRLLAGEAVPVSVYDKVTGVPRDGGTLRLGDCLIVEGALALSDPLRDIPAFRVFLDASLEILLENRCRRERALGFDDASILHKFQGLRADYEAHVQPQRRWAHLCVEVDHAYRFTKLEVPAI